MQILIIIQIILLIPVLNKDLEEYRNRYKCWQRPSIYHPFNQFKDEDIEDMGMLYQIALEVSKQNEESTMGSSDDADTMPDSDDAVYLIDSLREEL